MRPRGQWVRGSGSGRERGSEAVAAPAERSRTLGRTGRTGRTGGRGGPAGAARCRLARRPGMPSGPRASPGGGGGEGGPAARFSYHRNWSRDRSAGRSLGCSTAGPFSLPTAPGQGQTPGTARHCLYNSPAATTRLQDGAAAGFRKRPVPLQEPSRIFRSRRRTGDGKRRRKRGRPAAVGGPSRWDYDGWGARGRRCSQDICRRETLKAGNVGIQGTDALSPDLLTHWLRVSRTANGPPCPFGSRRASSCFL